jgi:hypothetical protein
MKKHPIIRRLGLTPAKAATVIKQKRAKDPDLFSVD